MNKSFFSSVMAVLAGPCLVLFSIGFADELHRPTGHCCPKCSCQQATCYKEVIGHACRMVEVKTPIKKIVYECKEVPYCEHVTPRPGECDCCPQCKACPKYKKVLVKKEVVCGEKCELKCVVEEVKQLVPICGCCECCAPQAGSSPSPAAPPQSPQELSPSDTPHATPTPAVPAPAKSKTTLQAPEFPSPVVDPSAAKRPRGPIAPVVVTAPQLPAVR